MKTLGQILGTSNRDVFEDDISGLQPGESRDFAIEGHHMRVTATAEVGIDTGRRRYRVECLSCSEIVHKATTGANWNIGFHVREVARRTMEDA